jgi:hypothetical protein
LLEIKNRSALAFLKTILSCVGFASSFAIFALRIDLCELQMCLQKAWLK